LPRGTQGIGQSTTVYLALRGATVYACAPDLPREHDGLDEASKRVDQQATADVRPGSIHFHALDLVSMQGARLSAANLEKRLKEEGGRLDILVNNAGIANTKADLSPDGFERTFAVNCLGHFVFINALLGKWYSMLSGKANLLKTS
jgi:NAD(P)-dependent dehydrogenase (short-subunit alcohol dehydrogenase family)